MTTIAKAGLNRENYSQWQLATFTKLNAISDTLSASMLDILRRIFGTADGVISVGVVDGYNASLVGGTMDVLVQPGLAFSRVSPAPSAADYSQSAFSALLARATATVTLETGSAQDRIDVVYLVPGEAPGEPQNVQIYAGGVGPFVTESHDQLMLNTPILAVKKGTPAPSPSPPSPPSYSVKVSEVFVPAGAVNLDTAGLTDVRTMLGRLGEVGQVVPWAAVQFNGSTGAIIGASFNVDSVTRSGDGDYLVTLIVPAESRMTLFPFASGVHATAPPTWEARTVNAYALSVGTFSVKSFDKDGVAADCSYVNARLDVVRG